MLSLTHPNSFPNKFVIHDSPEIHGTKPLEMKVSDVFSPLLAALDSEQGHSFTDLRVHIPVSTQHLSHWLEPCLATPEVMVHLSTRAVTLIPPINDFRGFSQILLFKMGSTCGLTTWSKTRFALVWVFKNYSFQAYFPPRNTLFCTVSKIGLGDACWS